MIVLDIGWMPLLSVIAIIALRYELAEAYRHWKRR
jgi:hypothetical protein